MTKVNEEYIDVWSDLEALGGSKPGGRQIVFSHEDKYE